jgi:hypothetical protein
MSVSVRRYRRFSDFELALIAAPAEQVAQLIRYEFGEDNVNIFPLIIDDLHADLDIISEIESLSHFPEQNANHLNEKLSELERRTGKHINRDFTSKEFKDGLQQLKDQLQNKLSTVFDLIIADDKKLDKFVQSAMQRGNNKALIGLYARAIDNKHELERSLQAHPGDRELEKEKKQVERALSSTSRKLLADPEKLTGFLRELSQQKPRATKATNESVLFESVGIYNVLESHCNNKTQKANFIAAVETINAERVANGGHPWVTGNVCGKNIGVVQTATASTPLPGFAAKSSAAMSVAKGKTDPATASKEETNPTAASKKETDQTASTSTEEVNVRGSCLHN